MTVNKKRANGWNVSEPHSSSSCGGDLHIDVGRFDSKGKPDKKGFGKHHVKVSDGPSLIKTIKGLITGKG